MARSTRPCGSTMSAEPPKFSRRADRRLAPGYLQPGAKLDPADAAAALIVDETNRYLVQLRDAKPTIFFPDHWGCFGGAHDPGESDEDCLARELKEELDLDLSRLRARRFTTFTFDFGFAGGAVIHRAYYEVCVTPEVLES